MLILFPIEAAPATLESEQPLAISEPMPERYTAVSTLRTRPKTYRKCVQLLAQGTPVTTIAASLRMSDNTVRAIRSREAQTIAERKQSLMSIFANVAEISAERMEQLAGKAKLTEAGIVAGISTDKYLLLAGEPTQITQVNFTADDLHHELASLRAEIQSSSVIDTEFKQLPDHG